MIEPRAYRYFEIIECVVDAVIVDDIQFKNKGILIINYNQLGLATNIRT